MSNDVKRAPRHSAVVDFIQHNERRWVVLEEDHEKVEKRAKELEGLLLEFDERGATQAWVDKYKRSLADQQQAGPTSAKSALVPATHEQLKPVAGQSRFTSPKSDWQPCSYEHHLMVSACQHEWPGYETRALYALPEGCVVVPRELLFQIAADCENDNDLCWITKELRAILAQQGQEVGSG